jgi:ribonuclease Y
VRARRAAANEGRGSDVETVNLLIGLGVGLLIGVGGAAATWLALARMGLAVARRQADVVLAAARAQAETLVKEADLRAKEEALRRREVLDQEAEQGRRELREQELRLEKREDAIDQKLALIGKKEGDLENAQRRLDAQHEEQARRLDEVQTLAAQQREQLLRVAHMTADEARATVLDRVERELGDELGARVLRFEQAFRELAQQKARELLATAIQRYAAPHTAETTASTIDIPSDDIKGRIIGREGRNIRAFEKATGVDVIVDDTPGLVVVTGFDNVRREIAKIALERLIQDGRIHPGRIEEVVAETQAEMDEHILRLGREAAQEAGVGGLHETLLRYLGRLKFRTSYSQNVLRHSIEVAFLTGMLADEIGLDGALGRRCGLLHDIGKAADQEMEGGHPQIGAELCRRFGESAAVVHAALGHHDDLRVDRPYTVLVSAADAISASRPGARRETLEKYVRRLEELEALACGFPGVEQVYAIQAGREVRVLVDSTVLDDRAAAKLCHDIAQAIEQQLTYPGEVKVTVLRETRNIEYAR